MLDLGRIALAGTAVGLGAAIAAGRAAESLLFGLSGVDPPIYVAAAGVLVVVTLGAGLLPARKAASLEPTEALRHV
jgi:ABC-type antimicrobial peptide transport system permease subunit